MNTANEIAEQIRSHGLKATRPRRLVLETLSENSGHWSVDQIVDMLKDREHTITRMSVYNAIHALNRAGLVMIADAGPGRTLYEVSGKWHHHFVCRKCGSVQDIPCLKGKKPCLIPSPDIGAEVDEAQVIFRGICKACLDHRHSENT